MGPTMTARVLRGAALLDTYKRNWWLEVSLETLDMNDPENCILGQLFGNYIAPEIHQKMPPLAGQGNRDFGFNVHIDPFGEADERYTDLDNEWHEIITVRRWFADDRD